MDLLPNDNERTLLDAVHNVVRKYLEGPRAKGVSVATHAAYSPGLYADLSANGFFEAAKEAEFGPVSAAMLIEEVTKSPFACEVGASALVAPLTCDTELAGPFALALAEELHKPIRFLAVAKTLLVVRGDALLALKINADDVKALGGMYAYPFGAFTTPLDLSQAKKVGDGAKALTYWRIALAAEGAGLMQAALDYTVEYVKTRRQFNRPIGSFQAVKHRLATRAQEVRGAIWLARRAAASGTPEDAAMATLNMQQCIPPLVYDCHQFNGAMGMTLECPLHFWTYRLKALQGELGGWGAQALQLADAHWGAA